MGARATVSPDGRHACLQWLDQSQSGWLLISLGEPLTVRDAVVVERQTNLMCEPVFSPDGRFIAATAARGFHWWLPPPPGELRGSYTGAEAAQRDKRREAWPRTGAAGGGVLAGWLWVHDTLEGTAERTELAIELPTGWGSDRLDAEASMLPPPAFVAPNRLRVELPDGTRRAIELGT